jgi:hypothetical protein
MPKLSFKKFGTEMRNGVKRALVVVLTWSRKVGQARHDNDTLALNFFNFGIDEREREQTRGRNTTNINFLPCC